MSEHGNDPHFSAARREFLRTGVLVSGALGTAGLPFALNLAASSPALAQASDYKAVVCLFLQGGNDAANMVLPTDAASWAAYLDARSYGTDPIALREAGTPPDGSARPGTPAALGGVLPITPRFLATPANAGRTFALHPSMGEAAALFQAGRLGVVANVGTLVEPLTRDEALLGTKPMPSKLFSHNDQTATWQALQPDATAGWGGRLADLTSALNAKAAFTSLSVSGNAVFSSGRAVSPYQVGAAGAVAIDGLSGALFGSTLASSNLRLIVTAPSPHLFMREHAIVVERSIDLQGEFQAAYDGSAVPTPVPYWNPVSGLAQPSDLALRLETVARSIGAHAALGARRQVFYVGVSGFDTHDNQNAVHGDLMSRLSHALHYFDGAMGAVGLRDSVVLFTASDFGRSFSSNGDGTDHGWGGHHFVLGGANVRGGDVFGRFPQVGLDHADAVASGSLLPALSVDQLGATIGRWFGLGESDLDLVFPNLRNFPSRDLGFMVS